MAKKRAASQPDWADTADQLGHLKIDIYALQKREKDLRQNLIDAGITDAVGREFRARVATYTAKQVDYRGLVDKLAPSTRIRDQFTSEVDRTSVRVTPLKKWQEQMAQG